MSGITTTVNNSTISGNTATITSAGIAAEYGSQLSINNFTISGNTAKNVGGASAYDEPARITGSTIAGNTSTSKLFGEELYDGGNVAGVLTLQNSIVAGDGSAGDIGLVNGGSGAASFSLVRNPSAAGGVSSSPVGTDATDITNKDPQLGTLASNGGPTPTLLPSTSSPVLDQGKSFGLTTDQRGSPRPFVLPTITSVSPGGDRSDMGAVEVTTPIVASVSPGSGATGMHVTVAGAGFTRATKVLFGSVPASSFTVTSDGSITAVAPAYNGPAVDVRVIGPLGESAVVGGDKFTYATLKATIGKGHAKLHGRKVNTGVRVSCPSNGPGCRASFTASTMVPNANANGKGKHKLRLGKGKLTLGAGKRGTFKFKLSKKALNELKTLGVFKITLQITATDGNGTPVKAKRKIRIKAPK